VILYFASIVLPIIDYFIGVVSGIKLGLSDITKPRSEKYVTRISVPISEKEKDK
jgi:hypothetical protein